MGGNIDDRKSTSGYVLKLNNKSAAVSWGSKKQTTVAISTAEAELAACKLAIQETIYISGLLEGSEVKVKSPIQIGVDNRALIAMCCGNRHHRRTKHVAIAVNFIKDLTEKNMIKLNYTLTNEMPADLLTKLLGKIKTENLIQFFNGN